MSSMQATASPVRLPAWIRVVIAALVWISLPILRPRTVWRFLRTKIATRWACRKHGISYQVNQQIVKLMLELQPIIGKANTNQITDAARFAAAARGLSEAEFVIVLRESVAAVKRGLPLATVERLADMIADRVKFERHTSGYRWARSGVSHAGT